MKKLLAETYVYLKEVEGDRRRQARAGALDDSMARKVAGDAKVSLPLGMIKAQDISKVPK